MKKLLLYSFLCCTTQTVFSQTQKTDLYHLVEKLLNDSTGFENVGDWGIGRPNLFPVKWKADKLEMSEDTSINFYRMGTANITINGRTFMQADQPVTWNIMLKGPRMGYVSFSILSSPGTNPQGKFTIDSIFGNKSFKARLLKSCNEQKMAGFYYYEVKIPKKDIVYLKISWLLINGKSAIRIDGYDSWGQYAAKLDCPG